MSIRSVEQGIAAIQGGNSEEGARLLRIGLKSAEVTGTMRAIACLWLAEITPDLPTKRQYYEAAVAADPNNEQIRQRVDAWVATQMMPPPAAPIPPTATQPMYPVQAVNPGMTPPPQPPVLPGSGSMFQTQTVPTVTGDTGRTSPFAPQQPIALPKTGPLSPPVTMQPGTSGGMYSVVGVIGGANGPGTAFFVAREGLLATTRYVVGGSDQLTIQLDSGKQLRGYVVRAFPEVDLAFIYVEQIVNDLIPVTPLPRLPDNAPLIVISYNGQMVQGKRRATKRVLAPQWFPTDVVTLPDAGGCPVLDERHYLIGMITRNTSSTSSYVYGLHINTIRQYVEMFRQETTTGSRVYCPHCGSYSQAEAAGGFYCEVCGALSAQAERIVRFPQPQMDHFYREYSRISCMYCNATVGFHKGTCLRCGRAPS
jgi:hypothetical protein